MAARRTTARDRRRRTRGQNFLVDRSLVARLPARIGLEPGQLVLELGAGTGALTLPLARAGARLVAVERDPVWAERLRARVRGAGLGARVRVVEGDLRAVALPVPPYRVVANVPFALTTAVLERLCDDPERGPWRADLLVQWDVARKRAAQPATTLRSASWAPWWSFELGGKVQRSAFRPVPSVDAGWLTVRKREPPVLPPRLAAGLRAALRPLWGPGPPA